MHEGVAKYIEAKNCNEMSQRPYYALLSYHFSLSGAGKMKEAFYYTVKAGEYAADCDDMTGCVHFYEMATLSLMQSQPTVCGTDISVIGGIPEVSRLSMKSDTSTKFSRPATTVHGVNGIGGICTTDNLCLLRENLENVIDKLNPGGFMSTAVRAIKSSFSPNASMGVSLLTGELDQMKSICEKLLRHHPKFNPSMLITVTPPVSDPPFLMNRVMSSFSSSNLESTESELTYAHSKGFCSIM